MKIYLLPLLLFLFLNSSAQEITETNTDLLLQQANKAYQQSDYQHSLQLTNRGLELAPDYHDIRLLQVRNYLALKNFSGADTDLNILLEKVPQYAGLESLVLQRVNSFEEAEEAIAYIKSVEEYYPDNSSLQVKKAKLYQDTNRHSEARSLTKELINRDKISPGDYYILRNILRQTVTDEVGFNYQYIGFSEDYTISAPWHSFTGEYQHNFGRTATIARVTYSERGTREGILYELEAYPVLNKRIYTFVNIGFSNGDLFPDMRGSLSIFYNFAKIFEAELGGRVQKYEEDSFYTGILGLTLYHNKFYFNARSFLGPKINDKVVQNYQGNVRYYYSGPENYLFIRIGNGISPDERILSTQALENPLLEAYYGTLGINFNIGIHHLFQISAGLLKEDLSNDGNGTQGIGSAGYRYRF